MSLSDITDTMQVLLGSAYVNDFDFNNRVVPRLRAGRPAVPLESGATSSATTCGRPAGQMMPLEQRRLGARDDGAAESSTTTTCSARPRSTARPRPATARARRCRRCRQLSARVAAAGHDLRVVGAVARGDQGGQPVGCIFGLGLLLVYLTLAGAVREPDAAVHHPARRCRSAILGALLAQWVRGLIERRVLPDRPGAC